MLTLASGGCVLFLESIEKIHVTLPFIKFALLSIVAWFICSSLTGTYKFERVISIPQIIVRVLKVTLLYILLVEATLNIFNITDFPRIYLNYFYGFGVVLIIAWRIIITVGLREYRRKGFNYKKIVIIGYGPVGLELKRFFQSHPELGYHFLGLFDNNEEGIKEINGRVEDVKSFMLANEVDEVYCSPSSISKEQLNSLTEFVDNNLIRMKILPELGEFTYKKLKIDFYDILPVLILRTIPLDDIINKFIKRTFDIVFSSIVIISILSWLLPILAIAIKLNSKGPVFFKQERSGINNKVFNCLKLRTMEVNTDANVLQARKGDSRITKVGAFLRKTSLDELPQFFNVFMGQMSIVGPRPHMIKHTEHYATIVEKFMVRHLVKPGITGLSQVRGFRGDTSELYQMRGRVKLDIFYLENWSFVLDLKIILYTVLNIIRGDDNAF